MRVVITEGSFLNLVATMVEEMETPKQVCFISYNVNRGGDITLTVHLDSKKGYTYDTTSVVVLRNLRTMYENSFRVFGTHVNVWFDNSYDC